MFNTDVSSGTPEARIETTDRGESIGPDYLVRSNIMFTGVAPSRFWDILQGQTQTRSEREFEEQKRLFEGILPLFLEPYRGLFVISQNGHILDADADLDTLTSRFFAEHGDVPIYLTKIGGQIEEVIDTPFVD